MAAFEKPEVKTLTQGVTWRAGGLPFAETVGLAGAAAVLDAVSARDSTDHFLYAAGRNCFRCSRPLTALTPARRTVRGGWQHDICPSVAAAS